MKSSKVLNIENYRDPLAKVWAKHPAENVRMMPTPMGMQPTAYIRNSRADKPHGKVSVVDVKSVNDGETFAMNLSWDGVSPEGGDFPDAVAVAFPIKGSPVLVLMGGKDDPIHILHWKANKGVRSMVANGIGLSDKGPELKISSKAVEDGKRWTVVITRPLGTGAGVAPVVSGKETKVGFALWSGANDERAGLKAFSIDWIPLSVEA